MDERDRRHTPIDCAGTFFDMALATMPGIDEQTIELLRSPQQEITVDMPLRTRDGRICHSRGYRRRPARHTSLQRPPDGIRLPPG